MNSISGLSNSFINLLRLHQSKKVSKVKNRDKEQEQALDELKHETFPRINVKFSWEKSLISA
jgi:hypothetical protein